MRPSCLPGNANAAPHRKSLPTTGLRYSWTISLVHLTPPDFVGVAVVAGWEEHPQVFPALLLPGQSPVEVDLSLGRVGKVRPHPRARLGRQLARHDALGYQAAILDLLWASGQHDGEDDRLAAADDLVGRDLFRETRTVLVWLGVSCVVAVDFGLFWIYCCCFCF